ncbi:hypothetical protein PV326_008772, partial [Microctonus aethiopoides]
FEAEKTRNASRINFRLVLRVREVGWDSLAIQRTDSGRLKEKFPSNELNSVEPLEWRQLCQSFLMTPQRLFILFSLCGLRISMMSFAAIHQSQRDTGFVGLSTRFCSLAGLLFMDLRHCDNKSFKLY